MSRRLLARLQKHHPPEKMLLLPGPRQVGKTTLAQMALEVWPDRGVYLNWDVASHRAKILSGEDLLADWRRPSKRPMIVFDELPARRYCLKTDRFELDLPAERVVLIMGSQKYSDACAEASAS